MTGVPAYVRTGRLDILGSNRLGRALYAPVLEGQRLPVNLARFLFLDPRAGDFYVDWDKTANDAVAILRGEAGRNPYDRRLSDLVGELSTRSEEFRTRWGAHNVRLHRTGRKQLHHPKGEAMTTWSSDELTRIGTATELEIASRRRDDTLRSPRTIWVVRVGDDLYVRSMYGRAGGWFPGTQVRHEGHIRAGGVDKDVTFADADPDLNDTIDTAYRDKYRRYGERIIGGVVNPEARAATIKLMPR